MITQNRSWTHDDSIPGLIGRKKVDWSIFEYGSTIPKDFITYFNKANGGEEIEAGSGKQLTLIWNDNSYQASIRNVDQKSADRETLQIRYHSNEMKELMMSIFKSSYEYILARKPQDPGNKKQVHTSDDLAEYIEFYSTGTPFTYELRMIPLNSIKQLQAPSIWWVNQGSTMAKEKAEGIMWAPLSGKGGRTQYHWDTMDEVKQGDIVLHYANGALHYVSRVIEDPVLAKKPSSLSDSSWEEQGRLVRVEYFSIHPNIPLLNFAQDILEQKINQGPIHSAAGVKQGYLFRFTIQGLQVIKKKSSEVDWPNFTLFDQAQPNSESEVNSVSEIDEFEVADILERIKSFIRQRGSNFPPPLLNNFYLSLKTKPFVILAGVSGTGKTKLVQLFAEAIGATSENGQYTLIPVRPDWSDPSDLIGYKDLSDRFRPGPLTDVLVKASEPANRNKPFFICLDEMNLARVEHYFSDILSILETQKRKEDRIVTDELIRSSSLANEEDRSKYGGLHIPDNVYLIGTVNMDETTHPFSKKVLDRANTIEFNEIKLDEYPSLTANEATVYPAPNAFLRSDYLQLVDAYQGGMIPTVENATNELVRINGILESIHSHVGFRIRDAICFYLIYNEQAALLTNNEAFDFQLLQKILPRIQGSNRSVKRVLLQLLEIALDKRLSKGELEDDASDLWSNVAKTVESAKYRHSAQKIVYMLRRLDEDGFTSYWLS